MKPNFVLVGVQKAATTSIASYLAQHRDVFMSPLKEPNFLERDWNAPSEDGARRRSGGIRTWSDYLSLFAGVAGERAVGEASANLFFHAETSIPQIRRRLPDARLICVLRNPVERAVSDWNMHLRDGIDGRTLEQHVRSPNSFVVRKGFYAEPLRRFQEAFEEQFVVKLHDDLVAGADLFIRDVFEFLGVDVDVPVDLTQRLNVSGGVRSFVVAKSLRRIAQMRRVRVPGRVLGALRRVNASPPRRPPRESVEQLRRLYRPDVLETQDLLGRDLSAWLD